MMEGFMFPFQKMQTKLAGGKCNLFNLCIIEIAIKTPPFV